MKNALLSQEVTWPTRAIDPEDLPMRQDVEVEDIDDPNPVQA